LGKFFLRLDYFPWVTGFSIDFISVDADNWVICLTTKPFFSTPSFKSVSNFRALSPSKSGDLKFVCKLIF